MRAPSPTDSLSSRPAASGDGLPRGRAAVGWRIGVYWKDDQKFYYGEVVSFDASTGRSVVVYTDGAHACYPCRSRCMPARRATALRHTAWPPCHGSTEIDCLVCGTVSASSGLRLCPAWMYMGSSAATEEMTQHTALLQG